MPRAGVSSDHWASVEAVVEPALFVAPASFLDDIRQGLRAASVDIAVARRRTAPIFDWLMNLVPLQGISDANAISYADAHGGVGWADIEGELEGRPSCPLLRSYWHFSRCGYQRTSRACAEPQHLAACPLPTHPLRKGVLNQAAYCLFLFIRDVCCGDLVSWIDERLRAADPGIGSAGRAAPMRVALLGPLRNVFGISDKLWSMMLADLLLGADPARERWVSTGASMIAVDTLVHNFLHRTGTLRRFGAEHAYGASCYAPGGCAAIIEGLAHRIDARAFSPDFPVVFPRFIQHAIWRFCAQDVLNVCNGNQIDDLRRCGNSCCPASDKCDRIPLRYDRPTSHLR